MYDEEGCPAFDSMLISVVPNVYAPNVIRPISSDGNDRFTLFTHEQIPAIAGDFIRWGEMVFRNGTNSVLPTIFRKDGTVFQWKASHPPGVYAFIASGGRHRNR